MSSRGASGRARGLRSWGNIAKRHEIDDQPYTDMASASGAQPEPVCEVIDRTYTAQGEFDNSRSGAALV